MKIVIGTIGATEQPLEHGYSQGRGPFTRRTWKCTDLASANALIPQLLASGYSYTLTRGPVPTVIGEISSNPDSPPEDQSQVTNTWEKTVVPVQKDILDTDFVRQNLDATEIDILNNYKKTGELTDTDEALLTATGQEYAEAIAAGVTSFLVYQTILRHTQIVSAGYPLSWTTNNDGRILTNAQLVSFEGLPSDLKFAIPASSFGSTYLTGWLKIPATVQSSSYDKWVVTQEYQYGEWLNLLYDAAS